MYINFFPPENLPFYEIMCENVVESGKSKTTVLGIMLRFVCRTDTHSKFIILIADPRRKRLSVTLYV